jgi:hypothetical protein
MLGWMGANRTVTHGKKNNRDKSGCEKGQSEVLGSSGSLCNRGNWALRGGDKSGSRFSPDSVFSLSGHAEGIRTHLPKEIKGHHWRCDQHRQATWFSHITRRQVLHSVNDVSLR